MLNIQKMLLLSFLRTFNRRFHRSSELTICVNHKQENNYISLLKLLVEMF